MENCLDDNSTSGSTLYPSPLCRYCETPRGEGGAVIPADTANVARFLHHNTPSLYHRSKMPLPSSAALARAI